MILNVKIEYLMLKIWASMDYAAILFKDIG